MADAVLITWKSRARLCSNRTKEVEDGEGWVWFCIQHSDGFDVGGWSVDVEFAGSGDRKAANFTVEE